ncbi:hypothetical protein FF1_021434 [Malus domestica]
MQKNCGSNNNGGDNAASNDGGEKKKGDEGEMKKEESPSPSSSRLSNAPKLLEKKKQRKMGTLQTWNGYGALKDSKSRPCPRQQRFTRDVAYCIHASFKKIKQDVNYIGEN